MPVHKSKPAKDSKSEKGKKASGELRDDDLRSISGGLTSTGGVAAGTDKCVSQT
jgi:hypothetical protein